MDGEFDELSALRQRVRLLNALLDALERMDEINQAVRKSRNRMEARHILTGEPFGYTETVARHILDLSVGRQTIGGIEEIKRERDQASERLQTLELFTGVAGSSIHTGPVSPVPTFILASSSSARLRVLRDAGFDPEVAVSGVDETVGDIPTSVAVTELAERKARAVAPQFPQALVLACDTMLELDGTSLGKPGSEAAVIEVWGRLAGRQTSLWTGHFLIDTRSGATASATASTLIRFGSPNQDQLHAYASTGDALSLAGAFSIEGRGGPFVDSIDGSPSNVLGLSLPHLRSMLAQLSVPMADLWRLP